METMDEIAEDAARRHNSKYSNGLLTEGVKEMGRKF